MIFYKAIYTFLVNMVYYEIEKDDFYTYYKNRLTILYS